MSAEIPGAAAPAETSSPQQPFERAQALFKTLPFQTPARPQDGRQQTYPDGSMIYASELGQQQQYTFHVYSPVTRPEDRNKQMVVSFDHEGNGTLELPQIDVMLGEETVATTPQPEGNPISETGQSILVDWINRIVEGNQYSSLGLISQPEV